MSELCADPETGWPVTVSRWKALPGESGEPGVRAHGGREDCGGPAASAGDNGQEGTRRRLGDEADISAQLFSVETHTV